MAKTHWGFDARGMDQRVRPQDDFYRYAHGTWLKKAKIPANESRWGSFVITRVENEKRLKKIVEGLTGRSHRVGSPEQMLRDFYRAGMDERTRERLGVRPLAPYFKRIEALENVSDMVDLFAELEVEGLGMLWHVFIDQDAKDSSRYLLTLVQGGLGLPDRDYYLKDDAESKRVRNAYMKHIERLFPLVGLSIKDAKRAQEVVMKIEMKLAAAWMTKEDARDAEKTYHKLTVPALQKLTPKLNWPRFLKKIGASKVKAVNAMQPDFLVAIAKMLHEVPLEDWKTYLRFHIANDLSAALSTSFVRAQFNFYGKVLSGQKQMKPLWRRALGATNGALGELLGKEYVKKYFTSVAKKRMNGLVDDLFAAYAERIQGLDWMTPVTKKKALTKLRLISRKIGYPDKWRSYRGLEVRSGDYLGNLMRSATHEHKRSMRKLGKPVDRSEWGMYPQTVNAYCNFSLNEIVFPAGILQPPFFDLMADDAINYGCIGAVIGHELTHAFDDQGSKFDGKGNMKSWWTSKDRKRFEAKTHLIKEQYDRYHVDDGVPVNGQLTLGENIADLGGAAIAFDAYQRRLAKTGRKNIDGFSPEERFFLGFSIFDCEVSRPEATKMRVLTDPHSPAEFRVNGPLANLQAFYETFGLTKKDKLYREPKKRAKIW